MAKFRCVCGEVISTSGEIPNRAEWHLISDVDFDELGGDAPDLDRMYARSATAYRCPVSDHLWISWDGLDGPMSLYSPTPTD